MTFFSHVEERLVVVYRDIVNGMRASWNSTTCIAPNSKAGVNTFHQYILTPSLTAAEVMEYLAMKKCCQTIAVKSECTNHKKMSFFCEKMLVIVFVNHRLSFSPSFWKHSEATV